MIKTGSQTMIVAVLALVAQRPMTAQRPKVGEPARDFGLAALDGGNAKVRLASLRGHPVVISFWAAWCPPCVKEMPELAAVYTAERASGLEVLAVNEENLEVDEKGRFVPRSAREHDARLRSFVARVPMPFPVLLDQRGDVWQRYGSPMIPAMVFVDTAGIVRAVYYSGLVTADSLAAGLRAILPSH